MTTAEVAAMWDTQARAGTVTRDPILKQIEQRHIASHIRPGMRVLDAGCGDGQTLAYLAERFPSCEFVGFDYSSEMAEAAMNRVMHVSNVGILVGDVTIPPAEIRSSYPRRIGDWFDLVYTERVLINLPDWKAQRQAIDSLWGLKHPTGTLLCVESCMDGLNRLNELRRLVGLEKITPPWHNRYVHAHEMQRASWCAPVVSDFSSSYYVLSRVVNAKLAKDEGREPDYQSAVNQMALSLPPVAEGYGQTWSWAWRAE